MNSAFEFTTWPSAKHAGRLFSAAMTATCLLTVPPTASAGGFAGLDKSTLNQLRHAGRGSTLAQAWQDQPEHDHDKQASNAPPRITASDAARIARERVGGRLLNVMLEQGPDGPYYLVKILKQGRIRVVRVDARD